MRLSKSDKNFIEDICDIMQDQYVAGKIIRKKIPTYKQAEKELFENCLNAVLILAEAFDYTQEKIDAFSRYIDKYNKDEIGIMLDEIEMDVK